MIRDFNWLGLCFSVDYWNHFTVFNSHASSERKSVWFIMHKRENIPFFLWFGQSWRDRTGSPLCGSAECGNFYGGSSDRLIRRCWATAPCENYDLWAMEINPRHDLRHQTSTLEKLITMELINKKLPATLAFCGLWIIPSLLINEKLCEFVWLQIDDDAIIMIALLGLTNSWRQKPFG